MTTALRVLYRCCACEAITPAPGRCGCGEIRQLPISTAEAGSMLAYRINVRAIRAEAERVFDGPTPTRDVLDDYLKGRY